MSINNDSNNNNNNKSDTASLIVAQSKAALPAHLNTLIATLATQAIAARGAFTIALSGGSLPSFLSTLHDTVASTTTDNDDDDMDWTKWHVLLADERCVPESDDDCNLKGIRQHFLSVANQIPASQVYGIDQALLLDQTTDAVAVDYQTKLERALSKTGGKLDLAVLGFGPDGHTCSLFPGHALLHESQRWVAAITDSPKPPPQRITLTFPVLNQHTRHVIICGAGSSKGPILEKVLVAGPTTTSAVVSDTKYNVPQGCHYTVQIQRHPAPFPCAMVQPSADEASSSSSSSTLTWIVDADAVQNVPLIVASSPV